MSLRNWLIVKLGGCTKRARDDYGQQLFGEGYNIGKKQAKTEFAILPLPFTSAELAGKEYGTFITPAGFAHAFGVCNIPAPGQYGYEQRSGYIRKDGVRPTEGLKIHGPDGSEAEIVYPSVPDAVSEYFTPVIITVLR